VATVFTVFVRPFPFMPPLLFTFACAGRRRFRVEVIDDDDDDDEEDEDAGNVLALTHVSIGDDTEVVGDPF
jgi:hypothetical protein